MVVDDVRMEFYADVYELVLNLDKSTAKFGLKFNLSEPYRCHTRREISNLPFIVSKFREGRKEVYFQYREDFQAHVVYLDPNPDEEMVIVAIAKFIEPGDTRAVDEPVVH